MTEQYSTSPWSSGLIVMTIVTLIITIGAIILLCYSFMAHSYFFSYRVTFGVASVVLVVAMLISLALMPKGISKTSDKLMVHLLVKDIEIPIRDIEKISSYPYKEKTIRVFGIGGLFGYVGLFENESIGKFDSYVTDFKKSYVIKRKNKRPIVVTVANPNVLDL